MLGRRNYVEWTEYRRMIALRERLTFMTQTARKSAMNAWQKSGVI